MNNLPPNCDGCQAEFSVGHALQCKKGGLVILRHNEVRDEIAALAAAALTPSAVRTEPLITPTPNTAAPYAPPPLDADPAAPIATVERGDLLLRGFFERSTDCIIDVRVQDLDAPSYRDKTPTACLLSTEKAKKRQYQDKCHAQRRTFVPFVVSADGLLGAEAKSLLKLLAFKLAKKWSRPYSSVRGYVNARLSLSIVRGANLCLHGSHIKASAMSSSLGFYDDAEGMYCLHKL